MMWFQFEDCKPEEKKKKPPMVQNPQVFPCQYQKSEGSEVEKKHLKRSMPVKQSYVKARMRQGGLANVKCIVCDL